MRIYPDQLFLGLKLIYALFLTQLRGENQKDNVLNDVNYSVDSSIMERYTVVVRYGFTKIKQVLVTRKEGRNL